VAIPLPGPPSGLALSGDEARLFVTCPAPESKVCLVDLSRRQILATLPAGHTATAPVPSPDGRTLYVCNRFDNDVSVIDLSRRRTVRRIPVQRDPVAAAVTPDGKFLLVANQLPLGRADADYVAARVSVIDCAQGRVVKELLLPNGSGSLHGIAISPEGDYAAVTHLVARFKRITTRVDRGWMHVNAVTLIDLHRLEIRNTALLDDADAGAANPWGVGWSSDGAKLVVAHAGINEVSVSDFPMLLEQLPESTSDYGATGADPSGMKNLALQANYLPFLLGSRQRVRLPPADLGPRALVVAGQKAYTANYFSDTVSVIDLSAPTLRAESIPLGPKPVMDPARQGEFYFNDANLCVQRWQSCASCHPGEARVDGFNWDLLNDGVDNPKNTKSMLLCPRTPPMMSLGVRTNAQTAVRAGFTHILFNPQPESVATAVYDYLNSLKPVPSPHLVKGRLSRAAKRGGQIFQQAGCADCHLPGLFTDLHPHNVGTNRDFDKPTDKFYTPTLIEAWRTAPYLHDGSAVSIKDVLTTRNSSGRHGDVAGLSDREINDLCEYVLSL
jgi:YVTN family beta-propeller protein